MSLDGLFRAREAELGKRPHGHSQLDPLSYGRGAREIFRDAMLDADVEMDDAGLPTKAALPAPVTEALAADKFAFVAGSAASSGEE